MKASRLVSAITGFQVQPNKAIVGANAFAHESGIHQDGVLKNAQTYEIMRPEDIGLFRSNLVMGKHSGRHAFKKKLEELGYDIGDNALNDAFVRFKALADKKKEIFDEDIVALVDEGIVATEQRVRFVSLYVQCGSEIRPEARLALEVDGERAGCHLPRRRAGRCHLQRHPPDLSPRRHPAAVPDGGGDQGTDAQAVVTVRLDEEGKTVNGQAADTDTMVASARAYVSAFNKLLTKREKTAPAALSA